MAMSTTNQAAPADDWRNRLRLVRTLSGLRAERPDHGALAPLDAEGLAAAAANPDHSEAGRAAAAQALRDRGLDAPAWRVRVPGFIDAGDLARGQSVFFGWGRAVRVWSGRFIFLALVGILALVAYADFTLEAYESNPLGTGAVEAFQHIFMARSSAYLMAYLVLVAIPIWLLSSVLRRHPARIALLRKFNEGALSAPLERAIAHELRPFGHVATLSDRYIKGDAWGWLSTALLSVGNPVAALWFIVSAPARFVWRLFDRSRMGPAVVLNARDYCNLARRLRDRIGLNIQVAFAPSEALPVRTSDAWWRPVVRLLVDSSDAIIVDLSQVGEGTAWELDLIRDEQAGARCVFISLWGKAEEAQAALQRWGFANTCFYYAPDGEMQRRASFRAALMDAMRATHGAAT